jgi:hypothetical protein
MQARAEVRTETPVRYLGQLCKHFAHRLPVTQESNTGSIAFSAGVCRLQATDDMLILDVEANDQESLAEVEDVVARHLLRFAFRTPPTIEWTVVGG